MGQEGQTHLDPAGSSSLYSKRRLLPLPFTVSGIVLLKRKKHKASPKGGCFLPGRLNWEI